MATVYPPGRDVIDGFRRSGRGHWPRMAVRIALALVTALRAVLIYGEATGLSTRPVQLPRFMRAGRSPLLDGQAIS
jgi:hypothetical protein